MNYAEICIIKRDGKREDFSISKIKNAIGKAFSATGIQDEQQLIADVTMSVISQFTNPTITVEEIQDLVEKALMKVRPEVAKKYIIYREWRNTERDKKTQMKHVMDGIVAIDKNDVNLSNANMSSHTPAGQMMTFASEVTKDYTYKYLLPKRFAEAHQLGDIHIHDLDYYPKLCYACHHHLPDQPERAARRTGNPRLRLLHGKRGGKVFPQTSGFVHQLLRGDGKRNTGGRESNPYLNQGTSTFYQIDRSRTRDIAHRPDSPANHY